MNVEKSNGGDGGLLKLLTAMLLPHHLIRGQVFPSLKPKLVDLITELATVRRPRPAGPCVIRANCQLTERNRTGTNKRTTQLV